MASVTLSDITHEYHDDGNATIAVDDIELNIEDGEFIVFVGPSGCGKTTTLEIISGLLQPTYGQVAFGDTDVTGQPARKRDIAMVFQSYALYPHMTVRENMAFPLRQRSGITGDAADQKVEDAATMMGIDALLDRRPSDLSGGQKQRVALGRAIVRDPEVFLMDEPLSNLDAKLRREMRIELQELHEKLGTTTIYVTHNQEEAMTMSDRIVIMNHGEIQQVGHPQDVYEDPANRFVAEFIGEPSMNFFEGTLTSGDETAFQFSDLDATVPLSPEESPDTDDVVLGVRPENVLVETTATTEVTGQVALVEPMGSHYEIQIEIENGASVTAMVDTDADIDTGVAVGLSFEESACQLYDAYSGDRVT